MADSKTMDPTPSTSGVKTSRGKTSQPVTSEDDMLTLRALEIVSKIAAMLKTDGNEFVTMLEKVLALVSDDQMEKRKMTYDLVENVMSNIIEADTEELTLAKQHFEKIFSQRRFKDLLIDEQNLIRLTPLGGNNFNFMLLGQLCLPNVPEKKVVIKGATTSEYNILIEQEASVLSKLKHRNILRLFGKHRSEPEIILEFMDLGSLLVVAEKVSFTTENLLKLLHDVASGMEYVAEKKYLHRNLSCEQVFLNKKKRCKIGGFEFAVYVGDSNGVYKEKADEFRHYNISPDTVCSGEFTTANDVWAMAILIWELFYNMEHSGENPPAVITKLEHLGCFHAKKKQLCKSTLCPEKLHLYILEVLNKDRNQRPNFSAVKAKIMDFITEKS